MLSPVPEALPVVFSGMVTAASMVAASINQRIHKYLLNYQKIISVRYQLSFKSNLLYLYLPKLNKPLSKCIFTIVLMYKPLVVFKFISFQRVTNNPKCTKKTVRQMWTPCESESNCSLIYRDIAHLYLLVAF